MQTLIHTLIYVSNSSASCCVNCNCSAQGVTDTLSYLQPLEDVMKRNSIYLVLRGALGSPEAPQEGILQLKEVTHTAVCTEPTYIYVHHMHHKHYHCAMRAPNCMVA